MDTGHVHIYKLLRILSNNDQVRYKTFCMQIYINNTNYRVHVINHLVNSNELKATTYLKPSAKSHATLSEH